MNKDKTKLSEVEIIKEKSNYLRGTIRESLEDRITGALAPDDTHLLKFHGSYQQFDRETEAERKKQKLEPLYQFMVRVRVPGGIASAHQWLTIDSIAGKYANGTIKLTTRQAFQLHGIFKSNLKKGIQEMNNSLLDSIAACGDVNRNVMCNPNPYQSAIHKKVYDISASVSEYLLPKTRAYHEIWLDKEKVAGAEEFEPLYGKTYLPRKFKIAFAIPPYNDIDVFANDLGFIAIEKDGNLVGFNVAVGGGLGMTFGNDKTYPRLADVIGFCPADKVNEVAETVIKIQRDNGNREDRKNARFKYTIDRLGIDWIKNEINKVLGWSLSPAEDFKFIKNGDSYGWTKGIDNRWYLTLFIEGGRVADKGNDKYRTALRELAKSDICDFRLTGNQNLVLGNISLTKKPEVIKILTEHQVLPQKDISGLRKNSIACVALNTCSLAFAESERYLPGLIDKLDVILAKYKIEKDDIIIRMTGCPNGCGRPYLGEIGFVGRAPGIYNLYLGAGFTGDRLNKLYKEMLNEEQILVELDKIFADYSQNRLKDEKFGNFVIRKEYVRETKQGLDFHDL
jgi:sulfite reductase (NADPH) hemoprotein beta-component